MSDAEAGKALSCIATAAQTIRQAISVSLPVAPTQLMTMQIPGLVINPKYGILFLSVSHADSYYQETMCGIRTRSLSLPLVFASTKRDLSITWYLWRK